MCLLWFSFSNPPNPRHPQGEEGSQLKKPPPCLCAARYLTWRRPVVFHIGIQATYKVSRETVREPPTVHNPAGHSTDIEAEGWRPAGLSPSFARLPALPHAGPILPGQVVESAILLPRTTSEQPNHAREVWQMLARLCYKLLSAPMDGLH